MELNNCYWKLVKNSFLMPIVFFVVGLVYGAIFNFILSEEGATVFWSCVNGAIVGFFAVTMYLVLTFFLAIVFNQEYVTDKLRKTITILTNTTAFICMCYAITIIIGNNEPITLEYVWMHIVNLLFVSVVVGKANYDGKALRNFVKERDKHEHLTEPTDEVEERGSSKMILTQSMGDVILRSIPEKGIYHFDVVIQHMSDITMQNVIVGTIIVKIKEDKISTYEKSCDYIKDRLGVVAIMPMAKEIAIKQAQEIENFLKKY